MSLPPTFRSITIKLQSVCVFESVSFHLTSPTVSQQSTISEVKIKNEKFLKINQFTINSLYIFFRRNIFTVTEGPVHIRRDKILNSP